VPLAIFKERLSPLGCLNHCCEPWLHEVLINTIAENLNFVVLGHIRELVYTFAIPEFAIKGVKVIAYFFGHFKSASCRLVPELGGTLAVKIAKNESNHLFMKMTMIIHSS